MLYVRYVFNSYRLGRSSYGSIKQHSIPLGCQAYVDVSSTQFYSLFDAFLMGFVSRTTWCGVTNTLLWPFCPLTCMNSSIEQQIFSSYLLWSCRFVGFISNFCDRKIHAANSHLNAKPSYLTRTFFLWILSSSGHLELVMTETCTFANSESKTPAVWKRLFLRHG